jgi:hypothetical protein
MFVLVVLSHQRRRMVHINVTAHPTAIWPAPQVVDAFPDDTAPHVSTRFAVTYWHWSNAGLSSSNPGVDAVGASVRLRVDNPRGGGHASTKK